MYKKKIACFTLLFCFILSASWAQQKKNYGSFNSENNSSIIVTECSVEENNTGALTVSLLTVSSSIEITQDLLISDINVTVDLSHTFMGDITITLESPSGTEITLLDGKCDANDDLEATFDDVGDAVTCASTSPSISGTVKSQDLLSAFNGENSLGTWTLSISDSQPIDDGNLNSWSIEYCSGEEVLTVQNFNELNIVMYPNPATDVVSITFNNIPQLEVTFFDFLGRKVLSKTLQKENNGIDVSKLAAGTYMVQMKNENNEKIINNLIID